MITIDKKVIRAILKLSSSYDQLFDFKTDESVLRLFGTDVSAKLNFHPAEIYDSLYRLNDLGYIHLINREGHIFFEIKPRINHRFAWWLDTFSKRFLFGFVAGVMSGIIITVIGGLLLAYLRAIWGI